METEVRKLEQARNEQEVHVIERCNIESERRTGGYCSLCNNNLLK